MRAKRRAIVLSFLLSLCATLVLGFMAFSYQSEANAALDAQERLAAPPAGDDPKQNTQAEVVPEAGPSSTTLFLTWTGAGVASIVLAISFLLFRSEVEAQKDKRRLQKSRSDYYRQLKQYSRQMKGPPSQNT